MKKFIIYLIVLVILLSCTFCFIGCVDKDITLSINAKDIAYDISQDMYGLFLEDISYAGDGGLVSNLVSNNSFDYEALPYANWVFNELDCKVESEHKMNENNSHYLKVTSTQSGTILNKGYVEYYKYLTQKYKKGLSDIPDMGFHKDSKYRLLCYIKNIDFEGRVSAQLYSKNNKESKALDMPEKNSDWTKIEIELVSKETEDGGLLFDVQGQGTFLLDAVELVDKSSYGFNEDRWKYVSFRSDLYQALVDLNPSFIRFPGGCLCEGTDLGKLYNWKETIGPLCERKHYSNIWNDDENGKAYDNTNSLGYHEYFQLAEDLNAKALPILNAGMICQFQPGLDGQKYRQTVKKYKKGKISDADFEKFLDSIALRPGTEEFDAYVQDILDLIEYANGDKTTTWGAKRALNGHEEPFNIEYIGIGNENFGDLYWRNFDAIYKVLKEKHPEITIISSAGPWFTGAEKDYSWDKISKNYKDTIVDEHYYTNNNKMFKNNDFYDNYDRNSASVFVGEYATECQFFGKYITKNNMWSAVEEAGYMCGFERNGDIVKMAAYAPTFAKMNSQCWKINMIWFTSQQVALTPNYYTQMLFSNNIGKQLIKTNLKSNGVISTTTIDQDEKVIYCKIVNSNSTGIDVNLNLSGFNNINYASMQYISNNSKAACNEIGVTTILPKDVDCKVSGDNVSTRIDGYSVNVIRIYYEDNNGENAYRLPNVLTSMEDNVTKYTKPYITLGAFVAICVIVGLIIIGSILIIVLIHLRKNKKWFFKDKEVS